MGHESTAQDSTAHGVLRALEASDLPRHACAVSEDDSETVEVATLLASEAIASGGICGLYGNECWLALVEAHLSDAGFDVPALRAEGQVVLASSDGDVCENHGPVDAAVTSDSQTARPCEL
jgi:hypothetical protein